MPLATYCTSYNRKHRHAHKLLYYVTIIIIILIYYSLLSFLLFKSLYRLLTLLYTSLYHILIFYILYIHISIFFPCLLHITSLIIVIELRNARMCVLRHMRPCATSYSLSYFLYTSSIFYLILL